MAASMTVFKLIYRNPITWLLLLCLAVIAIYLPGVNGPFVFDDFHNLAPLENGINDFTSWKQFVFSGGSATGRPLVFASFTLNAQSWPADPFAFKLTNILIHCLNCVILFFFLRNLVTRVNQGTAASQNNTIALLLTFLWAVSPLHVTAIYMVVQRMTLLSGTFVLLAMWYYTSSLNKHSSFTLKEAALLVLALAGFGLLGILSKETAVLLPLFLFTLNYTLYRDTQFISPTVTRFVNYSLLLFPFAFLFISLFIFGKRLDGLWEVRDFTMSERVMTELRILLDYLHSILIPSVSSSSLYHDDIVVSKGLFEPISTLISLLVILALLVAQFIFRKKQPLLTLGIVWFFGGHLLESTVLPLELYFEHRNYIPTLGVVFIIMHLIVMIKDSHAPKVVAFLYAGVIGFVTCLITPSWKSELVLFNTLALDKPKSVRAQLEAARVWLYDMGSPLSAQKFIQTAVDNKPLSTSANLRLLHVKCYILDGEPAIQDLSLFKKTDFTYGATLPIANVIELKERDRCQGLENKRLIQAIENLIVNPKFQLSATQEYLNGLLAKALLIDKQYNASIAKADLAFSINPNPSWLLVKLENLLATNDLAAAKRIVQEIEFLKSGNQRSMSDMEEEKLATIQAFLAEQE